MLLIAENTPATSFYVPLLGVYLIMAMSFTSLSVIFAVIVSNFHARGTSPKKLPQGLRSFTIFISKILCMKLNHLSAQFPASWTYSACQIPVLNGNKSNTPSMNGTSSGCVKIKDDTTEPLSEENNPPMSKFNYLVLDSLKCLIEKHEERERESHLKGQWEEAAKVMDRFLFWLFLCGMISSTLYLLLILPLTKTQTVNTGET
ncbi:hypothetical protein FSP39_011519 [Pinctada imbricata]|uniref:Neurotransmitter-gated ion-channel transmembrane domain-containing protein n=1 Tax=Pinctada imbricata TaxID=66713 RepID=A0AA88Y3D2_PINIB|nr:hypothetical protein FSP39_011519 [Pinctada imbricata]